jgi:Arc/MetJ family transcription regulator
MRTNIVIDDQLMRAAMRAGKFRTKRAAVAAGLQLLSQVRAQSGIRKLRGKVRWQGDLAAMRASRVRS